VNFLIISSGKSLIDILGNTPLNFLGFFVAVLVAVFVGVLEGVLVGDFIGVLVGVLGDDFEDDLGFGGDLFLFVIILYIRSAL
jgi:hypothetical protein